MTRPTETQFYNHGDQGQRDKMTRPTETQFYKHGDRGQRDKMTRPTETQFCNHSDRCMRPACQVTERQDYQDYRDTVRGLHGPLGETTVL